MTASIVLEQQGKVKRAIITTDEGQEIMLVIPSYPGYYLTLDCKRVWSSKRRKRWLKTWADESGHRKTQVSNGSREDRVSLCLHVLVADVFLPYEEGKPFVLHKDSNIRDSEGCLIDAPNNLYRGTQKENRADAMREGHVKRRWNEQQVTAVYTDAKTREQRCEALRQVAQRHNMPVSTIHSFILKRSWRWLTDRIDQEMGFTAQ
jgi:hypothetical protein